MNIWMSRIIAIVALGLLLAAGSVAFDRQKLAWLNSTPANQVVAHQREVYAHGYGFQAFSVILMLALLVCAVEALSWCLRKINGTGTPHRNGPAGG